MVFLSTHAPSALPLPSPLPMPRLTHLLAIQQIGERRHDLPQQHVTQHTGAHERQVNGPICYPQAGRGLRLCCGPIVEAAGLVKQCGAEGGAEQRQAVDTLMLLLQQRLQFA